MRLGVSLCSLFVLYLIPPEPNCNQQQHHSDTLKLVCCPCESFTNLGTYQLPLFTARRFITALLRGSLTECQHRTIQAWARAGRACLAHSRRAGACSDILLEHNAHGQPAEAFQLTRQPHGPLCALQWHPPWLLNCMALEPSLHAAPLVAEVNMVCFCRQQ